VENVRSRGILIHPGQLVRVRSDLFHGRALTAMLGGDRSFTNAIIQITPIAMTMPR
jgi:hypothetical protein